jgi:uncharacterized protein (DUF1810 family)
LSDEFNLGRFISATNGAYAGAFTELRAGRKEGHWMWFIFPQLAMLGKSDRAKFFGISGLDEAAAFLADASLGPRLIEISRTLLAHKGCDAAEILGDVDALKLRSCMTLFAAIPGANSVFNEVLDELFDGCRCAETSAALS